MTITTEMSAANYLPRRHRKHPDVSPRNRIVLEDHAVRRAELTTVVIPSLRPREGPIRAATRP